jgi:hypothetical protein
MWLVLAAHDTAVNMVALATKLGYGAFDGGLKGGPS